MADGHHLRSPDQPPPGYIIVEADFAENITFSVQQEIMAVHFMPSLATILVVVVTHHADPQLDAAITGRCC